MNLHKTLDLTYFCQMLTVLVPKSRKTGTGLVKHEKTVRFEGRLKGISHKSTLKIPAFQAGFIWNTFPPLFIVCESGIYQVFSARP